MPLLIEIFKMCMTRSTQI